MKPRPFQDWRPSMAKNPLLQRSKVGHGIRSTRDLPDEDFRYGKVFHQKDGVKENFANYATLGRKKAPSSSRRVKQINAPKTDFVTINREAIRQGCTTAHEFREFRESHQIFIKPEETKATAVQKGPNQARTQNSISNRSNSAITKRNSPIESTEMKDCLTYRYGREAKEHALRMKQLRSEEPKSAKKVTLKSASRPTRASRGQTYKPPGEPTKADTFKMKRFLSIQRCAIQDKW